MLSVALGRIATESIAINCCGPDHAKAVPAGAPLAKNRKVSPTQTGELLLNVKRGRFLIFTSTVS